MKRTTRRLLRIFVFFVLSVVILILFPQWLFKEPAPPPAEDIFPVPSPDTPAVETEKPETCFIPEKKPPPGPLTGDTTAQEKRAPEAVRPKIVDKTPPHVSALPGAGRHWRPVEVRLKADEPAAIHFRRGETGLWEDYQQPIAVRDSLVLYYKGTDSAGNTSAVVRREYVVAEPIDIPCPPRMIAIPDDSGGFCMDRYEWPNTAGTQPEDYINWYMAADSCRTYGKRLCTATEWETACRGGSKRLQYPYGREYEPRTCNTETDKAAPSGAFEECRSYYGVYDLAGNLREWTATPAGENPGMYRVYGGFWKSRGDSRCTSEQYSFYPQNRFIQIGFRCCLRP